MKTIYIVLFTILTSALLSCEDSIDITQPGELNENNALTSVNDLQSGLNNIYFGLNTNAGIQISSLFTDETSLGFENGGQNIDLLQFQLNTVSGIPRTLWVSNYSTINNINRVLRAAGLLTIEEDEREKYEDIIGQLYAIRAAEYFELLTYFSTDLTDDNALGVIKLDFVPNVNDRVQLPRVSNKEIFDLIEDDISRARGFIDPIRSDPVLVTLDFLSALEARMALYRGNYALANTKAQDLINNFPLANRDEYVNMFNDTDQAELIFTGVRNQSNASDGIPSVFYFRNVSFTGGAFIEIGRALFNKLSTDDVRFDVIVQDGSKIDPDYQNNDGADDVLLIGKYPGLAEAPLVNDYKYFRVSEMHLIKAEALAQLGNLSDAATALKVLRDIRFTNPTTLDTYTTKEQALAAVLSERRIELAFEGHRYIDLKRLDPSSLDRDPVDCQRFNACTLGASDFFKYTFPIPEDEFSGNSAIRGQQNPGY